MADTTAIRVPRLSAPPAAARSPRSLWAAARSRMPLPVSNARLGQTECVIGFTRNMPNITHISAGTRLPQPNFLDLCAQSDEADHSVRGKPIPDPRLVHFRERCVMCRHTPTATFPRCNRSAAKNSVSTARDRSATALHGNWSFQSSRHLLRSYGESSQTNRRS